MSERRKFTDSFQMNDFVAVIRTEHGWHDGQVFGPIIEIDEDHCVVKDERTGCSYEILKPRDIILERSSEDSIKKATKAKINRDLKKKLREDAAKKRSLWTKNNE